MPDTAIAEPEIMKASTHHMGGDDIASAVVARKPEHPVGADTKRNVCATQVSKTLRQPATANRQPRTKRPTSRARAAASRANARKSTGPRTAAGKLQSSRNAVKWRSTRLLSALESKLFGQERGAAEELYQELVAPYERSGEPVPAMLAMHFQDLARLRLELQAWERIRDAQIEERWRQSDIKLRRNLHTLQHDLPVTIEEVFGKGLAGLPESPARAKHQVQCLWLLRQHLELRNFDFEPILHKLYGKALNPASDRAQTICIRCDRLFHPEEREPLTDDEYQGLIGLVALEQQEATSAYGLYLDDASMPDSARLASLGPHAHDRAMALQGERLRQSIDRKQRVIVSLLRVLRLRPPDEEEDGERPRNPERRAPSPAAFQKRSRKKDPKI